MKAKTINNKKIASRVRRHNRIRARIKGTKECPRLAVFRSNQHIYAQVIDDVAGVTLASASDFGLKVKGKVARAAEVGKLVAQAAKTKKVEKVAFDRGGFLYTGRVKALADAAREAGLTF